MVDGDDGGGDGDGDFSFHFLHCLLLLKNSQLSLLRLLVVNPSQRVSATSCLTSPWAALANQHQTQLSSRWWCKTPLLCWTLKPWGCYIWLPINWFIAWQSFSSGYSQPLQLDDEIGYLERKMDSRLLHIARPPWHHQVSGLLHPAPKKSSPAYKPHQESPTRTTRQRQASSPLAIDKQCPHPDVIRCHKVYHVILFKLYNSGRYQGHKLRVEVTCSPLFSRSLFFQEQRRLEWYGFFLFR